MLHIDVFNGDADGIFSLIQLRKVWPQASRLVTGVKRDNALLRQITSQEAQGAVISVLDVSFDKNCDDLARMLEHAESVLYIDHHQARTLFAHAKLTTRIDYAADRCTGLLTRDFLFAEVKLTAELRHQLSLWAIAAAYGDGLDAVAVREAEMLALSATDKKQLAELGRLVNYNGYGLEVGDLHVAPDRLYQRLSQYDSPFAVIADAHSPYSTLKAGYERDLALAQQTKPIVYVPELIAVQFEDAAWARRISGTYANQLAAEHPHQAIVVATPNITPTQDPVTLTVSLRAPKSNPQGAGELCAQFPSGGGRAGAGGVNALPQSELKHFLTRVMHAYR